MTGHRRQRMLKGRWVAAEGSVYPEFAEEIHVCEPFGVPPDWPFVVGWDPGYAHPTAVLWFAIAPNNTLFITDEIYEGGKSVEQHAQRVKAISHGRNIRRYYGDPQHMFSKTAQSPRSIADQLRAHGLSFSPWPRTGGNEETMVEAVRQCLCHCRADGSPDPKIEIFSTCPNTIMEFQSWSHKRTPKGELPPGEDKFEDSNNHAMDVVKGIVATRPLFRSRVCEVFMGDD
jgi:phage terminase large subunit